jgi:hypothetical protein
MAKKKESVEILLWHLEVTLKTRWLITGSWEPLVVWPICIVFFSYTDVCYILGYFFYQSKDGFEGHSARLLSPTFFSSALSSLQFYSYIRGTDVGSLRVSVVDNNGVKTSLWYKSDEQEDGWLLSCVPINKESSAILEFEVTRGSSPDSVIAVDNITVSDDDCHCEYY